MPLQGRDSVTFGHVWKLLSLVGSLSGMLIMGYPALGNTADMAAGQRKSAVCEPCHGVNGNSTNPTIPSLAGQPPLYMYYQLLTFQGKQRSAPAMLPFVENLSREDMQDLAAYYTAQTPAVPTGTAEPEHATLAQQLMQQHHCNSCHMPTFEGQKHIPRLAGQHYPYLVAQLQAFKAQQRTDMDGSMTVAAQPLSATDIEALADYLAHWRPAP